MDSHALKTYDIELIKNIIANIGPKHNVHVFGGFVRDHILPASIIDKVEFTKLSEAGYPLTDIDMWARTEKEAREFMDEISERYGYVMSGIGFEADGRISIWTLVSSEPNHPPIEVLLSPFYPVNDSPLNLCSYDGVKIAIHPFANLDYTQFYQCVYDRYQIRKLILQHRYLVFRDYYYATVGSEKRSYYRARLDRLRRRGWSIGIY